MTDILVVDDDENMRTALCEALVRGGYSVDSAADADTGLRKIEVEKYRMVVSDIRMPRKSGMELLSDIKQSHPDISVVLVTAYGTVDTAVEAMRKGADDYLLKPFSADVLDKVVQRVLNGGAQADSAKAAPQRPSPAFKKPTSKERKIVTQNKKMLELLDMAERTAASKASVLIQGESGTGKELLARFIHQKSDRADGPFVAINCAALPETLLESELFGYEKGAFTGAAARKIGKFELADGGTILLDEITEMDINLQAKLLRVIQEKEVDRVGGSASVPVNVRVIATSNRKLEDAIRQGRFREDLYFRLNVIPLVIPSLRERPEDIGLLADYFLKKFSGDSGKQVSSIAPQTADALKKYAWNGNIRELENVMERAVLLCRGDMVMPGDLFLPSLPDTAQPVAAPEQQATGGTVEDMERKLIVGTLEKAGNNRTRAAEMLGISIRTLRNKLNTYKLESKGA